MHEACQKEKKEKVPRRRGYFGPYKRSLKPLRTTNKNPIFNNQTIHQEMIQCSSMDMPIRLNANMKNNNTPSNYPELMP